MVGARARGAARPVGARAPRDRVQPPRARRPRQAGRVQRRPAGVGAVVHARAARQPGGAPVWAAAGGLQRPGAPRPPVTRRPTEFVVQFPLEHVRDYAPRFDAKDDAAALAIGRTARERGYYTTKEFVV